ncbi:MAG: peptidylprolyl isomerase [Gammaproteobacteria bacterium]|nr:MAG: peptidylprolyl isomerase [Gammaproteobacteria bacterium]
MHFFSFRKAPTASYPGIPEEQHVCITTEFGDIMIELFPDNAPDTVANFKKLERSSFYDGLCFHRVIPGFVAQGGNPKGDGTGGPGYKIRAEFNVRRHHRGTVAMARAADPVSAGSQFYICYVDLPHLDGKYTIFGQVVQGMDIVDRLRAGTVMERAIAVP